MVRKICVQERVLKSLLDFVNHGARNKKRRLVTKEERDQNFITKSFILNSPRVAKKFADITTATTTQ